jgi:phage gpG-like protein
LAEGISKGAFDTQGYGKWPDWKNPNYTNNANQVLVDTGQLVGSITSEVKK